MKTHEPGDLYKKFQKAKMKSEFMPVKKAVQSKKKKNWIAGAIKHPGALRRELGVKGDKPIPTKKLAAAAKKGGKEGKRAHLAETLKSFHHKKRKHSPAAIKGLEKFVNEEKKEKKHRKGRITPRKAAYWEAVDRRADQMVGKKAKKTMCKAHKKVMCKKCK